MPEGLPAAHFETLGCRLNQAESEGAARAFADFGFPVDFSPLSASSPVREDVAVCVLNTCTVTAKAEQKARRLVRLLLSKCPRAAVVVTGCYAELARDELLSMDGRVCVLGGRLKSMLADVPPVVAETPVPALPSELRRLFLGAEAGRGGPDPAADPFRLSTTSFMNHSRASLKIQDGCNSACTYCRIRLARGKSVSIPAEEAVARVRALEEAGYAEVALTGVNISQYRSESAGGPVGFTRLLSMMLSATGRIGIRISSLYPGLVDGEFVEVASDPRVRPHFHLSVQSGSDAVLARMRRPYRAEDVRLAVSRLRSAKADPLVACDVIAGFPGETDADFARTMGLLEDCAFVRVHAFPFSARPGTEAFSMRPMVPNSVAGGRVAELEAFSARSMSAYIARFAGRELPAVAESVHRAAVWRDRVVVHAVTENFIHCQILLPKGAAAPEPGKAVRVKVVRELLPSERTGESEARAELP